MLRLRKNGRAKRNILFKYARWSYHQFDANPSNKPDKRAVQDFRRKVLRELKKIKLAWPEWNYSTVPGVLILLPSTPAISRLSSGRLQQQ